jgi:phosphoglycerate dehydrogenase-like enzyme
MAEPLVVCVTFPPDADVAYLLPQVRDLARPVEVLTLGEDEPVDGPATPDAVARAEVLVAFGLPADIADRVPRLRWIQAIGSGVDHFPLAELDRRGILVTNAAGVAATGIAEFVMARVLQVWKDLRNMDRMQAEHRWEQTFGRSLYGRTIGIIGLGAIGCEVAVRARAFGMRVIGIRRRAAPGDTSPYADELYGPDALPEVLGRSDIVVLAAPATDETADLIDRKALAATKPGAVLCNIARGALVDEAALVEALRAGSLGAAILDVVKTEPLPPDDPLWTAPGVYLSPHSAVSVDGYVERILDLLADNVARYVQGRPLRNLVSGTRDDDRAVS